MEGTRETSTRWHKKFRRRLRAERKKTEQAQIDAAERVRKIAAKANDAIAQSKGAVQLATQALGVLDEIALTCDAARGCLENDEPVSTEELLEDIELALEDAPMFYADEEVDAAGEEE